MYPLTKVLISLKQTFLTLKLLMVVYFKSIP